MLYTIYKTTNNLNGKVYIGKHQTNDANDNYLGSGKLLLASINKYGAEHFTKEVLFSYDNEDEMNSKEAELVTPDFVKEDTNYNLCVGGHGGFSYIRELDSYPEQVKRGRVAADKRIKEIYGVDNISQTTKSRQEQSLRSKKMWQEGALTYNPMLGKTHTQETREKMFGPRGKYNVNKTGIKRGPYKKRNNNAPVV